MQIVRTVVWVLLLVALLAFSFFNWTPVEVRIWSNLILETKVPALVIVSFLLGLIPMWLINRSAQWRNRRRITALETATRNHAANSAAASTAAAPHSPATTPASTDDRPPTPEQPHEQPPKPRDEILR